MDFKKYNFKPSGNYSKDYYSDHSHKELCLTCGCAYGDHFGASCFSEPEYLEIDKFLTKKLKNIKLNKIKSIIGP